MDKNPLDLHQALRAAFTSAQLQLLETEPGFVRARKAAKTSADFAALCELGNRLCGKPKIDKLRSRPWN